MAWQERADCRGVDADLWFADQHDRVSTRQAIAICERCPVQARCLQEALAEEAGRTRNGRYGVRGGRTVAQRVRLSACSVGHPGTPQGGQAATLRLHEHRDPLEAGVERSRS